MKYWSIIIVLLVSRLCNAQPSDSVQQKLLQGELDFWQAQNDSVRFFVLLNKAETDKRSQLYADALLELSRAGAYCHGRTQVSLLAYEKMVNYFLSEQYAECASVETDSILPVSQQKAVLTMRLYSLNEAGMWQKCKTVLLNMCNTDSLKRNEIMLLPVYYKYKKPEKSRLLSSILPGLGETYSGYPLKGMVSFTLSAGFLAFGAYNVYYGYYVTGVVAGMFPFLRFYSGGKHLSAILAQRHNAIEEDRLKIKYREEISSVLQ